MDLNIDFPIPVKGGIINRTHMAKELVKKGYCNSISEAYEMYLKPAYVKRETLSPLKTISVIKKAGGTAVLAHLNQLKVKENEILEILKYLKENGLSGIEAYYPEYTDEFTQFCLELCKQTHLLPSGGSDYHGENKKNMLGTGFGSLKIPYSFLEGLRKSCQ
jgi:predicted metal-dependent phosphoesterase TrpH